MYLGGEKVIISNREGSVLHSGTVSWTAHGGAEPTAVAISLPKHEHNAVFNQSDARWTFAGPKGIGLPFEIGEHYAIEETAKEAAQ